MTNEEKIEEIISISNTNQVYDIVDFNALHESLYEDLMEMAEWKDEQFLEEKKKLLSLVNLLHADEHNQTIIEDLKALLK